MQNCKKNEKVDGNDDDGVANSNYMFIFAT